MERVGGLLLAALAPLALIVVDPAGWYPFGPSKWAAISVVGATGSLSALLSHDGRAPRRLLVPLGVFVGAMAVAAAVGEEGLYAWIGTPERHLGVLTSGLCAGLLLAGRTIATPRGTHRLVAGLVIAGLGVGGIATAEALGLSAEVLDLGGRLTGTFGSAAYLGAACALLLPVAIGLAADREAPRSWRLAAGVAVGLLLVAVAGVGHASAAWVGLAAAGAATVLARRRALAARVRADRTRAAGSVALAVVVGVLVVVLTPVGARLGSATDDRAAGGQGRLDEWRVAASVVADDPLLGVGPEGYRVAFAGHVDAAYQREHGREQQPDRAHAGPLDVLLAGGVVALAAWLAVVGTVGVTVVAALRRGPAWLVGVAAGLVAHLVTQLLFFPIAELEPIAWLLAGVVLVAAERARPAPAVRSVVGAARTGAVVVVALIALAEAGTGIVADHRAGTASDTLARGDGRAAAVAAEAAVELRPDVLRLHLLAARALVADQRGTVSGLAEVDDALALSPGDPIARLAKARLLVDRAAATTVPAHLDAAAGYLDRLLEGDPHEARLWALRADVAVLEGDATTAGEARARARDLTPPPRA